MSDSVIRRLCLGAIGLGLAVRLALLGSGLIDPERMRSPDTAEYETLADNLWNHGAFSRSTGPPLIPDMQRTPGLPALWSLLHMAGLHGPRGRAAAQALLGLSTCLVTGLVGARIGGPRLGLAAAAVLCLDPLMATYSVMLLAEALFAFAIAVWLGTLAAMLARPHAVWAVAVGATWGLATLVKPVAQVLLPVGVAVCALPLGTSRQRAQWVVLCLVAAAAVVGPWLVRNAAVHGVWSLSSIGPRLFFFYHGAAAEAWGTGRPLEEVQREWDEHLGQSRGPAPSLASDIAWMSREGWRGIASHPWAWAKGCLVGLVRIAVAPVRAHLGWLLPATAVTVPLMILQSVIALALWAGCAAAALRLRREGWPRAPTLGAVLAVAILLVVFATGGNANARFRVPAMPPLALVGLWGLMRQWVRVTT